MKTYDLTIIGAGPVGLYAGFYAGMRGLSVNIIEAFEQAGGQPRAVYPEKLIYDVAGLPAISGEGLTQNLLGQLAQVPHDLQLGERVEQISKSEDFEIQTSRTTYPSKSVLLTSGAGRIEPRRLGIEGEEDWKNKGKLSYFAKDLEHYRGKKVAILGGGDSALDWALMLENVAAEVHLVHRREKFRAHEQTIRNLEKSKVLIHRPYQAVKVGNKLELQKVKADEGKALDVDLLIVAYGFLTQPIELFEGLELSQNGRVKVGNQMQSNIEGLYAAGDAVDYEGKLPLIALGFGEGIQAINHLQQHIELEHGLRTGHSSSLFGN